MLDLHDRGKVDALVSTPSINVRKPLLEMSDEDLTGWSGELAGPVLFAARSRTARSSTSPLTPAPM
ncbi:MAG: hypothetical protein WAU00_21980 [Caldilinea sp.]|nr:hypothetical protein [Caldilinea sp.]